MQAHPAREHSALTLHAHTRDGKKGKGELTKVLTKQSRALRPFCGGGYSAVLRVIQSWRTSANVDIATLVPDAQVRMVRGTRI